MKGFIPLNEFARRVRVHWKNAYRMARKGQVRACSVKRGSRLAWYVAEREVARVLKHPPWERPDWRGRVKPKRMRGPASQRVNNPAWAPRRATTGALKRLP